ncbi:MAG: hypothetical protein GY694_17725, partial [Gammaproteobacteria bacterium]|nr:hypothetical protein [Gammaproteobacteria bacterium]
MNKIHAPTIKEGKEEVRANIKNEAEIDDGIVEQSAEKTTEAIEQSESAKTATHKNVTNAGGERRSVKESSKETYGTEGDKTVGESDRSETNGQEESKITEKLKGEKQPEDRKRALPQRLKNEQEHRAKERQNTEEQSHKGARIPTRRETPAKNGHAVEKRDNAVER